MLPELVLRFFIGGIVVSVFAVIGDVLKPKSFAGLFGAAPSVALATLGLAFASKPASYVAIEARSMVIGAVAFGLYSLLVTYLLARGRWPALLAASTAWAAWLVAAFALWAVVLR